MKLDMIKNLHQVLEDLKHFTMELDADITELTKLMKAEEFIPGVLGESIIEKLTNIARTQKDIEDQFTCLELGVLPSKIEEAGNLLEECRKNLEAVGKYTEAVKFFVSLQSEDENTQTLLDKRKEFLSTLNPDEMDENALRETAESYVWLFQAFYETDPVRKFSLMYKLAGKFEEPIAMGVQFGTLRAVKTDSAAGKIENNTEELEPQKEIGKQNIWEKIGIEDPLLFVNKEDRTLLEVELSPKASDKFGVKEFKRDIIKQAPEEKIACLVAAHGSGGYSEESIARWKEREKGYYNIATDKLLQLGYLKKYTVKGFGEFYVLSPRGVKAFTSKDSLSFINGYSARKKIVPVNKEDIEDSANSAITRILYNSCFEKMLKVNEKHRFHERTSQVGTDYFFVSFPDKLTGKTVTFMGITSEKPEQFKAVYDYIVENRKDDEQYIVTAATHERASVIAKWVLKITENGMPIWYCGFTDVKLFDAQNDSEIEEKEPEEEQEEEQEKELEKELEKEPEEEHKKEPEISMSVNTFHPTQEAIHIASEEDNKKLDEEYQKMLISGRFYGATAYVKALARKIPRYDVLYRQLGYALNDPMAGCSYSSDAIFGVYYNDESPVSDYFVVSAAIRNYFYDQCSYDYFLPQLQAMVSGNSILGKVSGLDEIVYLLQQFKTDNHTGIDRYADYREKERASWEVRLEETRREAKSYYNNYCAGNVKENASHKRFIETGKLLMGPGSEFSEYLKIVINDDRGMVDLLEEFLIQNYIKDRAALCKENVESSKIDVVLDTYWDKAAQNMRLVKKTSDLMGSLRMNLFKRVDKIVSVLCDYVSLIKNAIPNDDDPAFEEYKKIRASLVSNMERAMKGLAENANDGFSDLAGKAVLMETLREMKARLEGNYKEGSNKYFYVDFLRNDKVLLDEDFFPVLDDVLELPEFSICNRIILHCQGADQEWEDRLNEIFNGEDDYGSAELIFRYLRSQNITLENTDYQSVSIEKAIVFPQKDMENKRREFAEDLELAQSYGQIDNTIENIKETILQIMETWYVWANETKNYGFFAKILTAFKKKIHKDAEVRAVELDGNLAVYLKKNPDWMEDERIAGAIEQIKDRIKQQNYAAAEDLLNRLLTNDLDIEAGLPQEDYLSEFLDEYDINYRKTANSGATLRSLVYTSKINKDIKGANKLLESWPQGAGVRENTLRTLFDALGFATDTVKTEPPIQGKLESYLITLKRPQNGRKNNYKHPISAFGSQVEDKGFRVVCIFGKSDASRLIDTFKEIGNAKNTIVLLDYALTLADRRTLARKTKTDLNGKIFAVIDRVVLVYLAKHYTETAINRMLMFLIMPFASYQPYIEKSADVMPPELFIGRKNELEKIESPTGVNIVYGGRQLGKTALLRMAKKDIDMDENGDRAIIVNAWRKDYHETAKAISAALYDEGILKKENVTEDWNELARDLKNRLRDQTDPIPYLLLMIDEADMFIESCEGIGYQPFDALKDVQSIGSGRFKFVIAGLRNIVRFKRKAALSNNSVLTHLDSLTVKPFKSMEARELLEVPLSYLGFRFPRDNETEVLVSTIFGTTNYFPGLIQLYCTKLIEAVKRDYAGYSESETPPYYVQKEHIKKVLAEQSLQQDIREKFFITLKVGEDDYYYIIALLVAYHYHANKSQNGCDARELLEIANTFSIGRLNTLNVEEITALMEEMQELNVLQHTGDGRYRFTRHSFCQMMGTMQQIDDELMNYMEE